VRDDAGLVLGSTFGSIDASAAFMHRIFAKGPRLASPAEFPNLLPSAPVGHVSIYLGLRGPALAASELGAAGESATMQAVELVAAAEADVVVAGDVEESHGIVERVIAALFAEPRSSEHERPESGAAVVLEDAARAKGRGARILARVVATASWREGDALPALPSPADARRASVIVARDGGSVRAALAASAWSGVARVASEPAEHDAVGAIAVATAAARIGAGEASDVLVLGAAKGRSYAIVLAVP
jgi:3-oxoacyl-[acyl-carrier-protein] synthase II